MTEHRLVLARHGQTEANVRMALDSAPPGPPLTDQGRREAAALGDALAAEPVVAVYASTAVRAQQTAAPIAARHGLDVEVVEGIQEVFVGDLEGRTDKESVQRFFEVFSAWATGDLSVVMPGGESGAEVIERYQRVVDEVGKLHPEDTTVLVSHGAVIRLVVPTLASNLDLTRMERAMLPNTGRAVLVEDPDAPTGWRCVEWTGIELP